MPENTTTNEVKDESVTEVTAQNTFDALQKMKENTVPRELYEKLSRENKEILERFGNGQVTPEKEEPHVVASDEEIKTLRESFTNPDGLNLEVVTTMVKLRDALIERGQPDPFLAPVHDGQVTANDEWRAQQTYETYKECIDYARGDSQLFTQELQRRMKGR